MGILRSQHFQKSYGLRIRLNPLSRTVRCIYDRLAVVGHDIYFSALGNEIKDHLIVATGSRIVQCSDSTAATAATEASLLCLLLNEPQLLRDLFFAWSLAVVELGRKPDCRFALLRRILLLAAATERTTATCRCLVGNIDVQMKLFNEVLHRFKSARRSLNVVIAVGAGA